MPQATKPLDTREARASQPRLPGRQPRRYRFEWAFFTLAIPALVVYVGFLVGPTLAAFYFSLSRWDGINSPTFVGIGNFVQLFNDDDFHAALIHTLIFTALISIGQLASGLGLALLLNRAGRKVAVLRGIFFAPSLLSSAVIALLWGFIFNPLVGILAQLANAVGLKGSWLADVLGQRESAILGISFVVVWQFAGYIMVIYVAGLKNIPEEVYEAASLDGATGARRFWNITWPLLAPSTSIVLTIAIAGNLRLFDQVYLLTGGGPAGGTETVGTLIYRTAFTNSNYGYSVTQSVVLTVLTALAVVIQRWLSARKNKI